MVDLIGDIHGHAGELVALLELLGYRKANGTYPHPSRRMIFLGDFIDRGPRIRDVLEIVRAMVLEGNALAVMGNHELNALAYHTPDGSGGYLRPHSDKNEHQHSQTLKQLTPRELDLYLDWFRTLPLWLDLPGVRAVHACWDDAAIAAVDAGLEQHSGVTEEFLRSACVKGGALFESVEVLLKGKEMDLPAGKLYIDEDGIERYRPRTKWYMPPVGQSYRTYAMQNEPVEIDDELHDEIVRRASPYPPEAKPVFVGHYWRRAERPTTLAPNVACIDYSVAKGGMLCAYRWDGEATLSDEKFVWVKAAAD